jgi:hypothetical protein
MLPASLGESQLDPTLLALHCIENRGKLGTGEWLALIADSWHELVEGSQSGTFEKKLLQLSLILFSTPPKQGCQFFSGYNILPKSGKIYQMMTNYTTVINYCKWPLKY